MLFLLLIAKKLVAASGRLLPDTTGTDRPKADSCPVNKSAPFSLRYTQPKVRMIVEPLLEMAQRNAAVFRPD